MPSSEATERRLVAQIAAHQSWANTPDRTARTAAGRAALDAKFMADADGDPVRADHLRKAHFARLALKSAQTRRSRTRAKTPAQTPQGDSSGGGHVA